MKTLREIYNSDPAISQCTDKDNHHSYLDFYEWKFISFRDTATDILEIGVFRGGMTQMLSEYFPDATVYGIDIQLPCKQGQYGNVRLIQADAYESNVADGFRDEGFDFIIDDGPHTVESQILSICLYVPKLREYGTLFIEDIQCNKDIYKLMELARRFVGINNVTLHDFRGKSGRYDDVIIEIVKGGK